MTGLTTRLCACSPPLRDGARCAKCGKPLATRERPLPPALGDRVAVYMRKLDASAGESVIEPRTVA